MSKCRRASPIQLRSLLMLLPLPLLLLLNNDQQTLAHQQQTEERQPPTTPEEGGDELFILLDEISVFSCKGVKNDIKLTEEDVQIVNERGNKVYFIKAPGNYSISFKRINVLNSLAHLSGELGITLQVPILEGPAGIRFDVPYTMVPETGLLNQQCDEFSGIVERDKRQYCRYCDLCGLTDQIERGLTRPDSGGHPFLPALAAGEEAPFGPRCGKIDARTYEFRRTLNLPGRRELEQKARQKISGVDAEIRKRLNKGRGRFQVFLNLISSDQPPITQKAWFDGSEQCRCCGRERDPNCRSVLSFLYCNVEDCKSAYAQQCLHNSARIVACYTVEFNYRMTTRREEVEVFLRENNYPDQDAPGAAAPSLAPIPTLSGANGASSNQQNLPSPEAPPRLNVIGDEQRARQPKELSGRCVTQMETRLTHLRRYCTIFWNEKLCCSHCPGVC
ncbi:hypothetical protein GPALN_012981 [Globodera pallida]|nr:hypothetical protein GPALN_012981 [Globodera pallida]